MKLELDKCVYNSRDTIFAKFSYDNSNFHKKITKIKWWVCRRFIFLN